MLTLRMVAPQLRQAGQLVLTIASVLLGFFLSCAALVILGLGAVRLFKEGPHAEPSGLAGAWKIIAPAWPIFLLALVTGVLGWRLVRRKT